MDGQSPEKLTASLSAPTRPQALAALREIARSLSTAWDLDTTLDLIARKTTEVMHVDSCTIYLLDDDEQTLRIRASTGLARRALGRGTLKVGEGMTGYAVLRNRPYHAADAQNDPHFKWVANTRETAFRSLLAVPLVVESHPIGALNVQTEQVHDFSGDEIEILSLIADLAAGALAKARLYDEQSRQLEELQALAQVSEEVTSPKYLDDILDVVTEMAARMMNAAVCSIFLLDETGQYLEMRSARRTTSPYRRRPPFPIGQGVLGHIVETGQSLYIADVRSDPLYLRQDLARDEGLVSLLAVPLRVRDKVIGVINCYTAQETQFSKEERAFFMTLANQTALAIENAHMVTNAAIVREMHHRIKNNLQTVAMLMRLQLAEVSPETQEILEASIHRVHSIAVVHEALAERGFHLVPLKEVIERIGLAAIETLTIPGRGINIVVDGESLLLPSRVTSYLALVINELIQNSLDHAFIGRDKGLIRISVGLAPVEIVITVADDGLGLPSELHRGLGLEIVHMLVTEELRGQINFTTHSPGAEAVIRIPRALEHELH
jgi:signal transduction protein with GAF and PtsI domain